MSIFVRLISKYSPAVMLPISAVVGFIGYKIENWISDLKTLSKVTPRVTYIELKIKLQKFSPVLLIFLKTFLDKYTPSLKSVKEKREERLLNEEREVESLKDHSFVPKTIFEKNLSPSLKEPDPRLKKFNGITS